MFEFPNEFPKKYFIENMKNDRSQIDLPNASNTHIYIYISPLILTAVAFSVAQHATAHIICWVAQRLFI